MKVGQKKTFISHELQPYFTHRSNISYHEGLLLIDQQIIVPSALRSEMKFILHQGHLGTKNRKKRACQALFWPSETPTKTEIPDRPWRKCAPDLFRLQGHYYLLIVD